ncbi:MAG: mycofactocin biosynthesis glycosyltransferase MftF, partial [Chloroflexaceae bacterium]|nr:mycofactocin biosynthesis glycosyltransferase MftF [Chloroflexaceae bacterium]
MLARHGLEVTLADVNPRLNEYARWRFARRSLPVRVIDLPPGPPDLPVAAFDFISAVDVFEHLPDPGATLTALATALRPGGALFIHLPGNVDPDHPMHLWRRPATLLRHLGAAGLWLEGEGSRIEQGGNARLLLRRGEGPRYRLNQGLELHPDAAGGTLLSLRPLVALRLNQRAFATLTALNGGSTALEVVAAHPELSLPTTTTFLDSLARRRVLVKHAAPPEYLPAVTAIVPAHGRPEATRACVESLLAQDYPAELLEVIVVDDASAPPLAPALAGLPIRLLRQDQNIGQSAARNRAAELARGEVLAFLDNDCVAAPGWLRTLVAALDEPGVDIAGGRVLAPPPEGPVAAFEAARSPLDMGPVSGPVGPGEPISYMPSCNLVVRRRLFARIGGFDPAMRLGEDVDLIWRALATGAQARYVAEGAVVHHHRVRLGALLRRRADYASSEADLQRRHPAGRRTMALPRMALAFLAALIAVWSAPALAGLIVAGMAVALGREIGRKRRELRRHGVHLPWGRVSAAVLLQHRAAFYHLGANITRYY